MKSYLVGILIIINFCLIGQNLQFAKGFEIYHTNNPSIGLDSNKNVYLANNFAGVADFDPSAGVYTLSTIPGSYNSFISKLDPFGNLIWTKDFKAYNNTYSGIEDIAVDKHGNSFVIGSFFGVVDFDPSPSTYTIASSPSLNSYDVFIAKLDVSGNFLWAKTIGSGLWDEGISIDIDSIGNVYSTGMFSAVNTSSIPCVDFDPDLSTSFTLTAISDSGSDIFILKLDTDGNFVWVKQIGGTYEGVSSISVDVGGNTCVAGYFYGSVDFDPGPTTYSLNGIGNNDAYVFKLNSSGNFVWAKVFGSLNGEENANYVTNDKAGNVYVSGVFETTADFNPGPGVFNLSSAGQADVFILKLDITGNFVWAQKMGGAQIDYGAAMSVDSLQNVYTTGQISDDIFVSKFNNFGSVLWTANIGSPNGTDFGSYIIADNSGNVYSTGAAYDDCDFDPGPATYTVSQYPMARMYILKLGISQISGVKQEVKASEEIASIYPNPVIDKLKIVLYDEKNTNLPTKITITDVTGKLIKQEEFIYKLTNEIDVQQLQSGFYILNINSEGMNYNKKFVKD
ncbi:MAG: T9SS type A sorting domain-containing protein [Bacteroidia bacterium]